MHPTPEMTISSLHRQCYTMFLSHRDVMNCLFHPNLISRNLTFFFADITELSGITASSSSSVIFHGCWRSLRLPSSASISSSSSLWPFRFRPLLVETPALVQRLRGVRWKVPTGVVSITSCGTVFIITWRATIEVPLGWAMIDDELVLAWIAEWLDVGDDRCEENGSFSSEFVTPFNNQLLFVDRRQCNECNNGKWVFANFRMSLYCRDVRI